MFASSLDRRPSDVILEAFVSGVRIVDLALVAQNQMERNGFPFDRLNQSLTIFSSTGNDT